MNIKIKNFISGISIITINEPTNPVITAAHLLKQTASLSKIGESAVTIKGAIKAKVRALANGIIDIE